jgi:hypothetical protein
VVRSIPPEVAEKLGHYVYVLADPGPPERIFYVGRGVGDRVFAHGKEALLADAIGGRIEWIRHMRASGRDVRAHIARHGLSRREAVEVEAALIDAMRLAGCELLNVVRGEDVERGLRSLELLIADLSALPLIVTEPALLVVINNTWVEGMDHEALWDAARREWACDGNLGFPFLLLAAARTIVRGVWRVTGGEYRDVAWADLDEKRRNGLPAEAPGGFKAWKFDGAWASDIADSYVGRHVRDPFVVPNAGGFRYLPDKASLPMKR